MEMKISVGIDIGGSHIGMGLYRMGENTSICVHNEPLSPLIPADDLVNRLVTIIHQLQSKCSFKSDIVAIGIGCPGQAKNGVLVAASNFPGWKNVPLVDMLSRRMGNVTTVLVNDADAAVAAEVWGHGVYRNVRNVAMITLGTGIGLGLILDGKLHSGANGLVEGGHMIADPHSQVPCGCGQKGCIEVLASARSTALLMQNACVGRASSFDAECEGAEGVFRRASEGDETAKEVIAQVADALAVFCISLCRIVDPEVIIFGGGMSHAKEQLLRPVSEALARRTWSVLPTDVRLVISQSAECNGVLGAALCAQHQYSELRKPETTKIASPRATKGLIFGAMATGLAIYALASCTTCHTPGHTTTMKCIVGANMFLAGVQVFGLLHHK